MGAAKELGGMGFWDFDSFDLDSFNLALLSKQLSKIHSRPESLVDMTLKEKYFKNSNISNASNKRNSSLAWCNFMGAK